MNSQLDAYPPNPSSVPPDLTASTARYRAQVVVVLVSLFLFLTLYLGLVAGSAWLSYHCISEIFSGDSGRQTTPISRSRSGRRASREKDPVVLLGIVGLASGVMCLFLVKGFFKRSRSDESLKVEITEREQPVLFAFIRRLCQDTRAPFPHRVYVTPDVNAAVFYHESILNLVLPTHKNLMIGLGLVNALELSEFKAVLAHEFGHFSQNSMKLGRYVYISNRIMGEIVYGRDWFDDLMVSLRSIEIRIAIFVWIFTGILWVVRKVLQGLFRLINFANSALSRQMEFSADLVAVSVTGSDALINSLSRLDFASEALGQTWADLQAAADHRLYTSDLYYHQTREAEYLRSVRKNPALGAPPPPSPETGRTPQVFQPEDTSIPRMWATHPSNYDREMNAKQRYVAGPFDRRSPWILFQNAEALKKLVSHKLYESVLEKKEFSQSEPEKVQEFIDAEHAETTYDPRYHGVYDDRYLRPGDLDELIPVAASHFAGPRELSAAYAELHGSALETRMQSHRAREEELDLLRRLTYGAVELRGKDFSFRGSRRRAADAPQLCKEVEEELDKNFETLAERDRLVFLVHCEMSRQLGEPMRNELIERYRFHLALQSMLFHLTSRFTQAREITEALAGKRNLEQSEFQAMRQVLQYSQIELEETVKKANDLTLPSLGNFSITTSFGEFLLSRPLVKPLTGIESSLDGTWINQLFEQIAEVLERIKRIHFKSLGSLLALQEQIADRWNAREGGEHSATVSAVLEETPKSN